MGTERSDLLQGTLAIVILKALLAGPMHGYAIMTWVEATSRDALRVEDGSLYPALRRLEDRGFVAAEWGASDNNRRAKYYTITLAGRRHLRQEASRWMEHAAAVTQVLRAAPALA